MKNIVLVVILHSIGIVTAQDTIIPLWPKGKIPNHIASNEEEILEKSDILKIRNVQEPSIAVYLPSKSNANGKGVLIFPGGGYGILAYDWEGTDVAKFLNSKGIAGIVVKYRLPSDNSQREKHNVPLIDAQRAIRLVRNKASEFNIDTKRIGIIGFSAGGHLASTLGTHFNKVVYNAVDEIDKEVIRPDFMALLYPVITFGEYTHDGSKKNLLGENPTPEITHYFSNEERVQINTPPTILIHATDDKVVPVENSLLFYTALKDKNIPVSLLVYPEGGHGFGLAVKNGSLKEWPERFVEWIDQLAE